MPGYIAKKLCPHLIFVKLDFTKYTAASAKVMAVLERYGMFKSHGSGRDDAHSLNDRSELFASILRRSIHEPYSIPKKNRHDC